jgi:hypothetical protein
VSKCSIVVAVVVVVVEVPVAAVVAVLVAGLLEVVAVVLVAVGRGEAVVANEQSFESNDSLLCPVCAAHGRDQRSQ